MSSVSRDWLIRLGLAAAQPRPRIFISYRRRDGSAGYAGRIADRLTKDFGADQCFRDVEDIETGTDFVTAIEQAVGSCDALVVVIGPDWLTTVNTAGQRRLDDPRDFVRLEIAAALQRDIRVIPVLVGGASMPAAEDLPPVIEKLAFRQALEITDTRWEYDAGRLVATLEAMGIPRLGAAPRTPAGPNYRSRLIAAAIGVVLLVGGAIGGAAMVMRTLVDPPVQDLLGALQAPVPGPAVAAHEEVGQSGASPVAGGTKGAGGRNPTSTNADRDRILRIMNTADSVSAEALRTRDASALGTYYTGAALAEQVNSIQLLVASGTHVHANLYGGRTIQQLQVDGDQAFAEIVLEFDMEFRTAEEQCVQRVPRHRSAQTTALVRQGGRWLIVQEQNKTPMLPQLC